MTPARSPTVGTQLGRYELVRELASTGVATLWMARLAGDNEQPPRAFSVLRLQRHALKNLEAMEALSKSARHAQKLKHPNVVAVVETVVSDGEMAVIGEHVEAGSLAALRLGAGLAGLPSSVCARIALDVLAALAAAHELSEPLLHGDLNPHHVLVGLDGVARVVGFGIVATLAKLGTHGVKNVERLGYAAPERVKAVAASGDGASATVASDLFSLAVLLWEGLARRRLFTSKIEAAVVQKVLTAPIPRLSTLDDGPKIPEAVSDVLTKALDRDPTQRYATAREFSAALEAAVGSDLGSAGDVKEQINKRIALKPPTAQLEPANTPKELAPQAPRLEAEEGSTAQLEPANTPKELAPRVPRLGAEKSRSAPVAAIPRPAGLMGARNPPRASPKPAVGLSAGRLPTASPHKPSAPKPEPIAAADIDIDVELDVEQVLAVEPASLVASNATVKPPTVESEPAVEPAPAVESEPAIDSAPAAESKPAIDSAPAVEPASAVQPEPAVEAAPASVEEATTKTGAPGHGDSEGAAASPFAEDLLPDAGSAAPWDVAPVSSEENHEDEETLQVPPASLGAEVAAALAHVESASAELDKPDLADPDDVSPAQAKRRHLAKLVVGGVFAGLVVLLGLAAVVGRGKQPESAAQAVSAPTSAPEAVREAKVTEPAAAPPVATAEPSTAPASAIEPAADAAAASAAASASSAAPPPTPTPPAAGKPSSGRGFVKPAAKPAPKPKYNPTGI